MRKWKPVVAGLAIAAVLVSTDIGGVYAFTHGELLAKIAALTDAINVARGGLSEVSGVVGDAVGEAADIAGVIKGTRDDVRRSSAHHSQPAGVAPLPYPTDRDIAMDLLDAREEAHGDLPAGVGTLRPGDVDRVEMLRALAQRIGEEGARARNRLEGYMYTEAGLLVQQQAGAARLHARSRHIRELACQEELDAIRRADEARARAGLPAIRRDDDSLCAERTAVLSRVEY